MMDSINMKFEHCKSNSLGENYPTIIRKVIKLRIQKLMTMSN